MKGRDGKRTGVAVVAAVVSDVIEIGGEGGEVSSRIIREHVTGDDMWKWLTVSVSSAVAQDRSAQHPRTKQRKRRRFLDRERGRRKLGQDADVVTRRTGYPSEADLLKAANGNAITPSFKPAESGVQVGDSSIREDCRVGDTLRSRL